MNKFVYDETENAMYQALLKYCDTLRRQAEALIEMTRLIHQGLSNREIAKQVGVTQGQVKEQRQRVKSGWTIEREGQVALAETERQIEGQMEAFRTGKSSLQNARRLRGRSE